MTDPKFTLDSTDEEESTGRIRKVRNRILFYQDVDARSASELTVAMHELTVKLQQDAVVTEREPAPIHLHIHSDGGHLDAGLAIVDTIRRCPVRVHTHIDGIAASAATLISVVGDHRTIGKHGLMLIHQLSGGVGGKFEEMKDELENAQRMMEIMLEIYQKHTKLSKTRLKTLLKRDLVLRAKEALEYGMVDEVV